MFDVNDRRQFDGLPHYFAEVARFAADSCPTLLVGCKGDLRGRGGHWAGRDDLIGPAGGPHPAGHRNDGAAVSLAEAEELAWEHGVRYVECSARDGGGVEQAVHALASAALQQQQQEAAPPPPPPERSKCIVQ